LNFPFFLSKCRKRAEYSKLVGKSEPNFEILYSYDFIENTHEWLKIYNLIFVERYMKL